MYKEFLEIAGEFIQEVHHKHAQLQQEEEKLRNRLDEIKEERSNFAEIDTCMESYTACGCEYPCPECFVNRSLTVEMSPMDSNNRLDIFRCPHCSLQIEIEIS